MQQGKRTFTRALLAFSFLLLAPACAPGADGEGYVVVDPRARAAGFFVELDGEPRSGPLPIAVPEGHNPVLNGPLRREVIAIAPGEIIEVRGAEGRIEQGATDLDQVRILASEGPARALAERIGVPLGADGRDRWLLRGRDVLPIAALLEEAKGIVAIEPVHAGEAKAAEAAEDDEAVAQLVQQESMGGFRSLEEQRQERARIQR